MITLEEAKNTPFGIDYMNPNSTGMLIANDSKGELAQTIVIANAGRFIVRTWLADNGSSVFPIDPKNEMTVLGVIGLVSKDGRDFDQLMKIMTIINY